MCYCVSKRTHGCCSGSFTAGVSVSRCFGELVVEQVWTVPVDALGVGSAVVTTRWGGDENFRSGELRWVCIAVGRVVEEVGMLVVDVGEVLRVGLDCSVPMVDSKSGWDPGLLHSFGHSPVSGEHLHGVKLPASLRVDDGV